MLHENVFVFKIWMIFGKVRGFNPRTMEKHLKDPVEAIPGI